MIFKELKESRLFWRYFLSYFIIIIVPVLAVSIFMYLYSIKVIESDVQKSNKMLLNKISKDTDDFINGLNKSTVDLLSSPSLEKLLLKDLRLNEARSSDENMQIMDATKEVIFKLQNLVNLRELTKNAYVYFVESGRVIDCNDSYEYTFFFDYINKYEGVGASEMRHIFSGKRTTDFLKVYKLEELDFPTKKVKTASNCVPVITSYPFGSSPKAYLVVNIKEEGLREKIRIDEGNVTDTLIMDKDAELICLSGEIDVKVQDIYKIVGDRNEGSDIIKYKNQDFKLSFVSSNVNKWKYISLTSLDDLLKPARLIKIIATCFLVFFSIAGISLSYMLSKHMYNPIKKIGKAIEAFTGQHHWKHITWQKGELELIEAWSRNMMRENVQLGQKISDMEPILHDNFIKRWLNGEIIGHSRIEALAGYINFLIPENVNMQVLCIDIQYCPQKQKDFVEGDKAIVMAEFKNEISEQLRRNLWMTEIRNNIYACIIHYNINEDRALHQRDIEEIEKVVLKHNDEFRAVISIGGIANSPEKLSSMCLKALRILDYKSFSRQTEIMDESCAMTKIFHEGFLSNDEAERIVNNIKIRDGEQVIRLICDIIDQYVEKAIPAKQMLSISSDILNLLIRESALIHRNNGSLERSLLYFDMLGKCVDSKDLKQLFYQVCEGLLEEERTRPDKVTVYKEVAQYIREHCSEDLSLEYFANQYNISLGYFSRSFKEEIGEKFVDFVNKCRIEEAKELLVHTQKKIEEISYEVGYIGSNSFNTIFKKYVGITPGKYRILYSFERDKHG